MVRSLDITLQLLAQIPLGSVHELRIHYRNPVSTGPVKLG